MGLWPDFPLNALLHEKVSHFNKDAIARESPRGDLLCYIATDERGEISRVRLHPPTLLNVAALPLAAAGQDVADVPAIVASLDYCFACADR